MPRILAFFLAVASCSIAGTVPARATVIVTVSETGGDVVFSGSGTLDLTAWDFQVTFVLGSSVTPDGAFLVGPAGPSPIPAVDIYETPLNFSGPLSIGPGSTFSSSTSGSGDTFGPRFEVPPGLVVPFGYLSGNALSGSSTYAGETFASLGIAPGTYVWSWGSGGSADSLTLNIVATVPEPSAFVLTGLGAGALLFRRRRRC